MKRREKKGSRWGNKRDHREGVRSPTDSCRGHIENCSKGGKERTEKSKNTIRRAGAKRGDVMVIARRANRRGILDRGEPRTKK